MLIPIKYNLRYLTTRWTGTLMAAFTFGLVVAVFIIMMSLARGIELALLASGNPLNVLILRPGVEAESQSSVQVERYPIIRAWPGIARDENDEPMVAPEVLVLVNKARADGKLSNLQIRGVHPQSFKIRPEVQLVQGRMFTPGLREIMVPVSVARRFPGMNLGDTPRFGRGRWKIVGLFDASGSAFESEVWADYQEIMQEFDRNAYSSIVLRVTDPLAVAEIQQRADADNRIKLNAKTEQKYYQEQTRSAEPIKAFGVFLAIMMSVGACFAGMNTMYSTVAGRVREIGTLRVLGFRPWAILISFQLESIALAGIGGVLGCILALPINGLATGTTNFATFSEIVFYFRITPDLMLNGILFALFMGAFGGLLPAISAARAPILSALRQI